MLLPNLRYLVTGCERSGTSWSAMVLRLAKVKTTQEFLFPVGGPRWNGVQEAEVSWMAAPHLASVPAHCRMVHVVRHPLPTITSSALHGIWKRGCRVPAFTNYAVEALGDLPGETDPVALACLYWVKWNEMIERHVKTRVRVEDGPSALLGALGIQCTVIDPGKKVNTRAVEPPLGWEDLPVHLLPSVRSMAARYGYPCSSPSG